MLENLVKTRELQHEPFNQAEFAGLLAAATLKLRDVRLQGLSQASQFSLAYGAVHALAVAALRWHGYRSDKRYVVFQCLQHTVGLSRHKCRLLDHCHRRRNLAEYEGHLDIDARMVSEVIELADELVELVTALSGPV